MRRTSIVSTLGLLIAATTAGSAEPQRGTDDYPLEALQKHEQGPVVVSLTVGTDGRPTDCSIVVSSRSAALDEATCKFFMTRARYIPARDSNGQPSIDHVLARLDWVIPGCKTPPETDPRVTQVKPVGTITSLQRC
jgi:TonB family protein